MKVTSIKVNSIGVPDSPCQCGEGEWVATKPGDLIGYRCSACNKLDWGEITFDEPEEFEQDVRAELNADGGATIYFGAKP